MAKYSKKAQEFIEKKMRLMKEEKKPQAQKVAIAMSYARKEGLKVPKLKKKSEGPDVHCSDHEYLANQSRRGKYTLKKWKP